jgi:uroporphyrinogen decarboxylase
MTGKELLFNAIKNQETPRPAWVPFVGVHGGKIINQKAVEYLQSSQLIVTGLKKARELYRPDGLPVVFDLQIEAEVLGCQLHWADEVPPSVISHPLESISLDQLPPFSTNKGRFPVIKKALRELKNDFADEVALYGLITGPFTLALHLLGNNIFLDMLSEPEKVKSLLTYCSEIGRTTAGFYIDNGVDIIAIVDPMTSQISPNHFNEFVTQYVNDIFDYIRNRNVYSSMFVCGDAAKNLEVMFKTHCDYVSIDENIPLEKVKNLSVMENKAFGGNLKLTSVLLFGSVSDCKLHAIDNIDTGGNKGFILSPGCDLPYACPEKNLQGVTEMVLDDYQREIARNTLKAGEAENLDHIILEDYASNKHITVEVGTLDSTSCAPCQYMYEAAVRAADEFGDMVKVVEHKISTKDGLGYMMKMGITSIPTICIDGEVAFSSIIPDQKSLKKSFRERLSAKRKMHGA